MSVGYLVAATADVAAAREIGDGFDLDVIDAATVGDRDAVAAALAGAANVGLILSMAAAGDAAFTALARTIAGKLPRAQLIVVEPEARTAFAFLPEAWPAMSLDEARLRAADVARRRGASTEAAAPPSHAPEPQPEAPEQAPAIQDAPHPVNAQTKEDIEKGAEETGGSAPEPTPATEVEPPASLEEAAEPPTAAAPPSVSFPDEAPPPVPSAPATIPPGDLSLPPAPSAPEAASVAPARGRAPAASAPADATAFAPKKLRRGTPELVRIVVHQPKDRQAVIKAARKIDARTEPAPQGMSIGDVALGASVGVALEVRGAACDGTLQRRTWAGEPIDFSFSVEADADVKQAVILARVFVDDAQIGVLAFTRPVIGAAKKAADIGDRVRLKRHKRVFLSYSSQDRETVAAIATAYQMAGVAHFWDRASLKSGEEWSPRLRQEIDRADLFHLCWSKSAASSEWVEKEAAHALTRRRRSNGKRPDITVQMLDGPPWAPHPLSLDSINFDDFVRAAIVGYARGDGS
jgi:hypothetical protein